MAPNSRRPVAGALATATAALLANTKGAPKPKQLRAALYGWASNAKLRQADPALLRAPNVRSTETPSCWPSLTQITDGEFLASDCAPVRLVLA